MKEKIKRLNILTLLNQLLNVKNIYFIKKKLNKKYICSYIYNYK